MFSIDAVRMALLWACVLSGMLAVASCLGMIRAITARYEELYGKRIPHARWPFVGERQQCALGVAGSVACLLLWWALGTSVGKSVVGMVAGSG